ncbi:MAG: PBECR2 nuclease fold domain-containing protein [Oscillospiraceae bacterium]|nr:PBECR2 nuclease fold domain-containing protein [Oscillospiraceae bacterium]
MIEKIGEFSREVIELLGLDVPEGTAIFLGESNRAHMKSRHPQDYEKYIGRIGKIVTYPDFVGISEDDGSIEFIKIFKKNVKVAVRIAVDGDYYARTLYEIHPNRVKNFAKEGKLFVLDKRKNI